MRMRQHPFQRTRRRRRRAKQHNVLRRLSRALVRAAGATWRFGAALSDLVPL